MRVRMGKRYGGIVGILRGASGMGYLLSVFDELRVVRPLLVFSGLHAGITL